MSTLPPTAPEPQTGLKLEDILFILFRHKGKIVLCFLLGLGAAVAQYYVTPAAYQSTAKLLVRYVLDASGVDAIGSEGTVRRPDTRGDTIINSEIEILNSWDLLESVARTVGPDRILGVGGNANRTGLGSAAILDRPTDRPGVTSATAVGEATKQIAQSLDVSAPNRGSVLILSYRNSDPEVTHTVLSELVSRYLEKHHAIHRASGTYDFLLRQTDQLRSRLNQTEDELLKLKNQVKIDNVEQAKTQNNALITRLTQSIRDAETELAGYQARLDEVHRLSGSLPATLSSNLPPVDQVVLEQYKTLNERLLTWHSQETELLNQGFTESYPPFRIALERIAAAKQQKRQLEADHPGLLARMPAATEDRRVFAADPTPERMQIAAIQARMAILKSQLEAAETQASTIESVEVLITRLERRRELERTNYIYFAESLERARVDATIDPKLIPNIIPFQEPSAPLRVPREMLKKMAVTVFGAIAAGVGLALLLDLVLDPSIKRPTEIESRLRIPLMLSIPLVSRNGAPRRLLRVPLGAGARSKAERAKGTGRGPRTTDPRSTIHDAQSSGPSSPISYLPPAGPERVPWGISHFVRPFCDALRDRLILLFQLREMTHRPKLVALTGCSEGAGVTTLSAGLAASLSETGAGKVLLVDMNFGQTRVHPFLKGEMVSSLSEMIQPGAANGGAVAHNLYLAAGTDPDGKPNALIPKKFYDLMPQLKASDFDYIIFDMPAFTQTSATMALAPFMDQVLLIIEAEKDSREQVKRAHSVLSSSRANVIGIFNKNRAHAPGWIQRDG